MNNTDDTQEMHIFRIDDPNCEKTYTIAVPEQEYQNWKDGMLIQDAMPSLGQDDRELLMTGTCPECWDAMMPKEDEM